MVYQVFGRKRSCFRITLLSGLILLIFLSVQLIRTDEFLNSYRHIYSVDHASQENSGRMDTGIHDVEFTETKRKKPPHNHIAFLKVHKCGSSTAQNVFLRYGISRNLTFLLGRIRSDNVYNNVISLDDTLNNNTVQPAPPGKTFDIMCFHVLYNKTAFRRYMPADSKYIGIIREPFDHFISIIRYFRPPVIYNDTEPDSIGRFLESGPNLYLLDNPACTEYGIPNSLKQHYDAFAMENFLKQLDVDFTLIIVSEYFEESMVLMRRYLNWSTKDILYCSINMNIDHHNDLAIKSTHRNLLYKRFKLDAMLYKYFHQRLWRQIKREGDDFYLELYEYKRLRRKVSLYCSNEEYLTNTVLQVNETSWSEGFIFSKSDCDLMTLHEHDYVNILRKRQYVYDSVYL